MLFILVRTTAFFIHKNFQDMSSLYANLRKISDIMLILQGSKIINFSRIWMVLTLSPLFFMRLSCLVNKYIIRYWKPQEVRVWLNWRSLSKIIFQWDILCLSEEMYYADLQCDPKLKPYVHHLDIIIIEFLEKNFM